MVGAGEVDRPSLPVVGNEGVSAKARQDPGVPNGSALNGWVRLIFDRTSAVSSKSYRTAGHRPPPRRCSSRH
jgi:hypothetical protein